ncbi:hypothetical protein BB558_007189 [Smittium angustum]|uniref:Uncharacterized protein n=1 Tax=Smittium angustum TaxID=133377 RepID=A0A2U1IVX2_SMIAN|nr:hypothetical protein BB558_007189 [Smittium angustum]
MNFKAQNLPGNFTQINPSVLVDCPSNPTYMCLFGVCDVNKLTKQDYDMINRSFNESCGCNAICDLNTVYNITFENGSGFSNSIIQKCSDAKSYKWKSSILLLGLLAFLI